MDIKSAVLTEMGNVAQLVNGAHLPYTKQGVIDMVIAGVIDNYPFEHTMSYEMIVEYILDYIDDIFYQFFPKSDD